MKTNKASSTGRKNIQRSLDFISKSKEPSKILFAVLIILYLAATVIVSRTARSQDVINIGDSSLSVYAFAGVFSSVANISIILLTMMFRKKGFVSGLVLLSIQTPLIIAGIVRQHNLNSLPGVFGNVLVIVAIIVIYSFSKSNERTQAKMTEQAITDSLTGLPNRFACSELFADLVKHEGKFAVVSIDINNFKNINDTMGFEIGNKVLIEIGKRWKTIADSGVTGTFDFIARSSGDEFVLVIRGYHSDEDIANTVKQYEDALSNRIYVDGYDLYVAASFGYAEFPVDAKNIDSLFTYADAAMTSVKRANSSNHVLRFSPEMLKVERTLEIEHKLRDALQNDTVYFNLQPQYDMSHKLRGFEALARMKDADGKSISPGEFIPVAEKVGLVDRIDGTVFRKSAIFISRILNETGLDITLSVNVSVRHLMKKDFLDEVREIVKESGIPTQNLEIEITESIMIDSVDEALSIINEIKAMGIQIAIDDFGTGYSSLSYLNKFPANLLKVDKSFIDKMNTSDSSRQYVAAIISIGHIMGFDVISEGVEEPDQLETLRAIGCDFIQGYIWGKPLSAEDAEKVAVSAAQER